MEISRGISLFALKGYSLKSDDSRSHPRLAWPSPFIYCNSGNSYPFKYLQPETAPLLGGAYSRTPPWITRERERKSPVRGKRDVWQSISPHSRAAFLRAAGVFSRVRLAHDYPLGRWCSNCVLIDCRDFRQGRTFCPDSYHGTWKSAGRSMILHFRFPGKR